MKENQVFGIIRAVLAGLGGVVGSKGYVSESEWSQIVGAIMVLLAAGWSVIEKRKAIPVALIIAVLLMGLMCGGCATTPNDVALARVAADTAANYYQQPNSAEYMELEGSSLQWSITGATKIRMSGPIPCKSIYPREEGTLKAVLDGAGEITKTVALGYVGAQGVKALRAQKPTVVTTERLVPVQGAAAQ